jgi:putative MATE family efflux protein
LIQSTRLLRPEKSSNFNKEFLTGGACNEKIFTRQAPSVFIVPMKNEVFETYSIPRAIASMGIPSVVGSLVIMLYNMADTYFIGQLGDPNQVAAVALTLPLFFIFIATGSLLGIGGSSLISRNLGKGDYETAKKTSTFCFYACICVGLLTTLLVQVFMDRLLPFLGSGTETYNHVRNYLGIVAYGSVFIIMQNMFTSIVRSIGASKAAMAGQMIGTLLNVVLDPLFVLVFGMGTSGIAIATVIGTFCASVYYLFYLKFAKTPLSIGAFKSCLSKRIAGEVIGVGFPPAVMTILSSVSYLMYNKVLIGYGEIAVSASAVATRGGMLSDCFQSGMAMGIQPLVGYHYAAGNHKKMRNIINFNILVTILIGILFFALLMIFASPFIRAFINNDEVVSLGRNFLRIFIITTPISGILFTLQFAFQGMGKKAPSMVLTVGRQAIFLFVIFLGQHFGGMYGIISAQPIATVGALMLAVVLYFGIKHDGAKNELPKKV